jgi:hypothetical protein
MSTKSILEVVSQFDRLIVEDYQRTYSWEKDEIDDFFIDLKDVAITAEPHFFGTLIMQSGDDGKASVVDGQQRLTTTYLTVAALRDAALRLDSDVIAETGKLPIYVSQEAWSFLLPANDPAVPRFLSNKFLRTILMECVLPVPANQASIPDRDTQITLKFRKAIKQIRTLVRDDIDKYDGNEEKLKRIHSLLNSLLRKFMVLSVVTETINESLEIFLTLNNRGLPLGPSDLVRGEVMSVRGIGLDDKSQRKLHSRIFDEWRSIAENVDEPEVFLRHYLVATGRVKVTKKKVVESVLNRIKNSHGERSPELAEAFWKDLYLASETYSRIIRSGYENELGYQLYILNGLLKSHRIFLLGLLRSDASEEDIKVAVRLLYVLCFRYIMAGRNAQQLEDFFQGLCIEMKDGASMAEINRQIRELIEGISFDLEKYLKGQVETGYIGRAILHGINRKLAPSSLQFPLDGKLHLEHIAPKSETDEWVATVFSGREDLYDDYEDTISEIGNLTLLDEKLNLEAQQKPFGLKKEKYEVSGLEISRHLTKVDHWRQEEIEARTTWIAECFNIIWHATPSSGTLKKFADWYNENK